jgi:hypothetical protein
MLIIKRLSTCFLALALLVPAISFHDDAIRLSAFVNDEGPYDDSLTVKGYYQDSNYDPALATLLEGLEYIHAASVCSLHIDVSSTPCVLIESVGSRDRSVAAPVGRAPPLV